MASKLFLRFAAFIPNKHPTRPNYVRKLPNAEGRWVIPGPTIPYTDIEIEQRCFGTDDRFYDSSSTASFRVQSESSLIVNGNSVSLMPVEGRALHRTGITKSYNSITGELLEQGQAETTQMSFGSPVIADQIVQLALSVTANNPLVQYPGTPSIDYSGTVTWDMNKQEASFRGSVGLFPAFEAYVSLDGGPYIALFQMPPAEGAGGWHLYDLGLGLNTRSFDARVDLKKGTSKGSKALLTREGLRRELHVASALIEQKRGAPESPILTAIAVDAVERGQSFESIAELLHSAKASIDLNKAARAEFGLDIVASEAAEFASMASSALKSDRIEGTAVGSALEALLRSCTERPASLATRGRHQEVPDGVVASFKRGAFSRSYSLFHESDTYREIFLNVLASPTVVRPDVDVNEKLIDDFFGPEHSIAPLRRAVSEVINEGTSSIDVASIAPLVQEVVGDIKADIKETLKRLTAQDNRPLVESVLTIARVPEDVHKRLEDARRASNKSERALGRAEAGLSIATSLFEHANPKLASDIRRVGTIAISLARAVSGHSSQSELGGLAVSGGLNAVSGNWIGAAFALSSLASSSGPTADEIMVGLLQEIQAAVETLRQEMHERFDRIDSKLDAIHEDLLDGIQRIFLAIKNNESKIEELRALVAQLDLSVQDIALRLEIAIEGLFEDLVNLDLAAVVRWKENSTAELPFEKYFDCIMRLVTLATKPADVLTREALWADILRSDPAIVKVPTLVQLSITLGQPLTDPGDVDLIPRPKEWMAASASYLQLAQDWPEHFAMVKLSSLQSIVKSGRAFRVALNRTGTAEAVVPLANELFKTMMDLEEGFFRELNWRLDDLRSPDLLKDEDWPPFMSPVGSAPTTRVAKRLRVGSLEWKKWIDNRMVYAPTRKRYEALYVLWLVIGGDKLMLEYKIVGSKDEIDFPWLLEVGGVVGVKQQGDTTQLMAAVREGEAALAEPQQEAFLGGEMAAWLEAEKDTEFSVAAWVVRDNRNVEARLEVALAESLEEAYRATADATAPILKELSESRRALRELARVGGGDFYRNNDVLFICLEGKEGLLASETFRDALQDPRGILTLRERAARDRDAAQVLFARVVLARERLGVVDREHSDFGRILDQCEEFLKAESARRAGRG